MNDRVTVATGAHAGAILGATAAHLLLTERGRRFLRDLRPAVEDLSDALREAGAAIERLGTEVREVRRVTREIRSAS
jgi:DNA-binding transcriptional LysR family regulator